MSPLRPADQVIEGILDASTSDDTVVIVEEASEAEVRFAQNTTTTNGVRRDRRVTVIALRAAGTGVATRSGEVDLEEVVRAAERDAAGAAPADDASPLVAPADTGAPGAGSGALDQPPVETGLSVMAGVLGGLGGAFARAGSGGRTLAGFAEHRVETLYLGTSRGLFRRHVQPTGALHLVARADGGTRSAWVGAGTPDFSDIDIEEMEERLVERLAWSRRQVPLEAGRYETIVPPDAVADLMVAMVEAMSGREAEEGRTAFSRPGGGTKVGTALSRLAFDLRSDPAEPGLECRPFLATSHSGADVSVFDNGLGLSRTDWVDGGVLQRLRYHRAGARRSEVGVSPPIDNLVLELPGATASLDDLVAGTERGLMLTCLWYIREVDPATLLQTGLTRDGVYLIEEGKITGAVNNFRFNESPVDLLARATEVSRSRRALGREFGEWVNRTSMPALRIPDFNMSTVSPAS